MQDYGKTFKSSQIPCFVSIMWLGHGVPERKNLNSGTLLARVKLLLNYIVFIFSFIFSQFSQIWALLYAKTFINKELNTETREPDQEK